MTIKFAESNLPTWWRMWRDETLCEAWMNAIW